MNRIVLIGNGFDLAHGLKTSYADFINWYWKQWKRELILCHCSILEDPLCSLELDTEETEFTQWHGFLMQNSIAYQQMSGMDFYKDFSDGGLAIMKKSKLLTRICQSIETKGWVDIEADYYALLKECLKKNSSLEVKNLHEHFAYLQEKLIEYLSEIQRKSISKNVIDFTIQKKLLEAIREEDIAVSSKNKWNDFHKSKTQYRGKSKFLKLLTDYYEANIPSEHDFLRTEFRDFSMISRQEFPKSFYLPENVLLLDFNYTNTSNYYLMTMPQRGRFSKINIHGTLDSPQSIIFGYGDEMDKHYQELEELNDNNYLTHIKSSKYLEASNYRKLLQFVESAPYQIYIMGHSCGNSDRTLLHTLFEHENCVSIKPFYYQKEDGTDNYTEIAQNISRNFKDKQALRAKVVPKDCCEPLPQASTD